VNWRLYASGLEIAEDRSEVEAVDKEAPESRRLCRRCDQESGRLVVCRDPSAWYTRRGEGRDGLSVGWNSTQELCGFGGRAVRYLRMQCRPELDRP
jgi:hypothetical protein